jgi:hypothetical protein
MKGRIHFTEPLRSNNRRDRHTDKWEGFMKYAVEMGSGAMMYEGKSKIIRTFVFPIYLHKSRG